MCRIRQQYVRKEKIRISIGTWNINGDKNPALEDSYPSILDAWILDGPENLLAKKRKTNAIETKGLESDLGFNLILVFQDLSLRIIQNPCRIY
jgi:hypothetical protein